MGSSEVVGTLAGLWRFPVKSMAGERLEEAEITERGTVGDRAYALVDAVTGKVVSAKSVRLFPDLLRCRAAFVEPPQRGVDPPPVRITLPDGTSVTSGSGDADRVLSACFGREVTLARTAPEDYTIDQYHPDVEGLHPAGHRDEVVDQKLGAALFAENGVDSPVPPGSFFDAFPVSVVTTSTLEHLGGLSPDSRFDERRFRMNLTIRTAEHGFLENGWVGRELAIGDTLRLTVAMPGPRCVMTTLAQEELPEDTGVLRALVRHNRLDVGDMGRYPCAGAFAVVAKPGSVRKGDPARLG